MAILVGIDEAGYGPLLGPLVVSSTAFEIPDDMLRDNLWDTLKNAVSTQKRGLGGRIMITDSKKAYTRSSGIAHLRKTVMSAISCLKHDKGCPENAADLVKLLDPLCAQRLPEYPWYQQLPQHELGYDQTDIHIAGTVLEKTLSENNMKLLAIRSRCLDAGIYNHHVRLVKNKSRVLFTELCSLILDCLHSESPSGNQPTQIVVDRQGGRINYQNELLRMFPGFALTVIRQDEKMSSYEMSGGGKQMRLHFCIKADAKFLPVSLASMVSKYLREVLMESLNDHFCHLYAELKRTAGYWQDGQRFVKDIQKNLPDYTYDREKLIRIS